MRERCVRVTSTDGYEGLLLVEQVADIAKLEKFTCVESRHAYMIARDELIDRGIIKE
jgi:hypothetical protein